MHNNAPSCICLQETFHGVKTPPQPSQYTAVSATPVVPISSTRPSRGVVTLIKNTVPYRQINIVTNLEAIAIRANIKNTEYTICNIYISPTEPISTNQITQLTDQLPTPFLLVGDFNARSELWGDVLTNGRGTRIDRVPAGLKSHEKRLRSHEKWPFHKKS